MDDVVIAAAKYLIYAMVIAFGLMWLFAERRRGKVELAIAAVVGLGVVLVLIKIASVSYFDVRPFVPVAAGGDGSETLIPHAPDNGFPSDHSSAAGLMAGLILLRRQLVAGLAFAVAAAGVAWGRVAAGVHHLLDVAVGLGLGVVAAVVGTVAMTALVRHIGVLEIAPLRRWLDGARESSS